MTLESLNKIIVIEDETNREVVLTLLNILNSYGYLIGDVTGNSDVTSDNSCDTKLYDGVNSRYICIHTDIRKLDNSEDYVHIGIELRLCKKLTYNNVVDISKHVLLNTKDIENKLETTILEMIRKLIF